MTLKCYDFDADEGTATADETAAAASEEENKPTLFFASEDERLRYRYRRTVGRHNRANYRWRAAWFKREGAGARIEVLWRSWEKARFDGGSGMSDWWINHCDRAERVSDGVCKERAF